MQMFPFISRLRMMRHWGGVTDRRWTVLPSFRATPVDNFYINGGWCYGGQGDACFGLGIPHTMANDTPHELNECF